MALGLIGKKVGMTRLFDQATGAMIPVTVIDVKGNTYAQIKKEDTKDGYNAIQVAFDEQKESRLSKPIAGHLKKHGAAPAKHIQEFRVSASELPAEGAEHPGIDMFTDGQWVDVIGTSKGQGFQGVMVRHNYHGQRQTHGSMMHRRPGAIAAGSSPGRVWKNQPMPGRHGNFRRTVQNLRVAQIRKDDNVILISGPVPGARGSYVVIRAAVKKAAK